ncbi:NACHT domain-containing protein [Agrobacterium radiobacter]|uniref:NACHT domain-containing protein n=1 Tax=Agrobacterium radiobacter TaxID=362 RepID=UPI003F85CA6E
MTDSEINVNEIAGHAAADLVESFFSSVGINAKDQIAKAKIRFGKGFSKYLNETLERYSRFKTLINRYDAIDLGQNYVPARITTGTKSFRSDEFFDVLNQKKRFIVEGTAGLGKTLFVRHLLCHTILYERNYIPILFELRNLHLDNTKSLVANLVKQVSDYIPGFNEEHFRFGLDTGKFVIYLDGIDEISLVDRSRYASEILDLAYRYPETPILLSTRPDDFYLPWEVFKVARLQPMTRDQTLLMLSKLQFDADIKAKFVGGITSEYFADHSEFLSVPLLATLMLMTYSEFAAVPDTMHIFYEQAYQTLFHKHDFIKGAYLRKVESGLDIERFRLALSAFCFITYLQERFSFLQFQALEDISDALSHVQITCDREAFLKDLLVTMCLLQRDGNQITFIHRSFQEYFAALFISKSQPSEISSIMDALVIRSRTDNVVKMIFQLNPGVIEREWVLPQLKHIEGLLGAARSNYALVQSAFGSLGFRQGISTEEIRNRGFTGFRILLNEYGNTSGARDVSDNYADDWVIISRYLDLQANLAEKEQPYNHGALTAYKRARGGDSLPLSVLPLDLVENLRCINEMADKIRKLGTIKDGIEAKHIQSSDAVRSLLSKYRK